MKHSLMRYATQLRRNCEHQERVLSMGGSKGGGGEDRGSGPPLKNHKNIGFLSNTGPDPLKNHKATKPTRERSGSVVECLTRD